MAIPTLYLYFKVGSCVKAEGGTAKDKYREGGYLYANVFSAESLGRKVGLFFFPRANTYATFIYTQDGDHSQYPDVQSII